MGLIVSLSYLASFKADPQTLMTGCHKAGAYVSGERKPACNIHEPHTVKSPSILSAQPERTAVARHHCMDGMSLRIFEVAGGKRENRLTGTKSALKQDT